MYLRRRVNTHNLFIIIAECMTINYYVFSSRYDTRLTFLLACMTISIDSMAINESSLPRWLSYLPSEVLDHLNLKHSAERFSVSTTKNRNILGGDFKGPLHPQHPRRYHTNMFWIFQVHEWDNYLNSVAFLHPNNTRTNNIIPMKIYT